MTTADHLFVDLQLSKVKFNGLRDVPVDSQGGMEFSEKNISSLQNYAFFIQVY